MGKAMGKLLEMLGLRYVVILIRSQLPPSQSLLPPSKGDSGSRGGLSSEAMDFVQGKKNLFL